MTRSVANENDESVVKRAARNSRKKGITVSSTAEYFSKNLQQVGFSSPTKAVLTTVKEAFDNSLDACEESNILPSLGIYIEKKGPGSLKNTDQIMVRVEDNGPGIDLEDIPKVFGEYLASSKFGRGRCSRGQQGIGISAATTWALQTTATGARVITKKSKQRKAISCLIEMDLKNNKGVIKSKETIDWDRDHGTSVEFLIDGRIQLNGEAGLNNYIKGNVLVNPHMTLTYQLPDMEKPAVIERVTKDCPKIPDAVEPHPHTMKLGEFIAHAALFGNVRVKSWLKKGFSRVSDKVLDEVKKIGKFDGSILEAYLPKLKEKDLRDLFVAVQQATLMAPSTSSVLSIGEAGLSKSIERIGDVDFFSVVTRRPTICDFKPVQIEVAVARLKDRAGVQEDDPCQVLRFANRVPLQFDKAGCAIVKSINTVNWRNYGLRQPKNSLPLGPYIIAVSVVSPFIKFKNASKETIDSSDELVEEIRRALMQAGQRLSRHIRREAKEQELEEKIQHIEQFGPILVETLGRIIKAPEKRKEKARQGLMKILGRDAKETKSQLVEASEALEKQKAKRHKRLGLPGEDDAGELDEQVLEEVVDQAKIQSSKKTQKKAKATKTGKRSAKKVAAVKKKSKPAKKSAKKPAKTKKKKSKSKKK